MNSKFLFLLCIMMLMLIYAPAQQVFTKDYIKKNSVKSIIRTKYTFKEKKGKYDRKRILNYTMLFDINGNKVYDDTMANVTVKNSFNEQGLLVQSTFKAISWGSSRPPSMFKYNSATHSYDDSKSLLNGSQRSVVKITTEFEYDNRQNLKKRSDDEDTDDYYYDKDGRLSYIITTKRKTGKADTVTTITYNDKGLKSTEINRGPNKELMFFTYYYDDRNKLVKEFDSLLLSFSDYFEWINYGYDDKDRLITRELVNSETNNLKKREVWIYDKNDRLTTYYTTSNYYSKEDIYELEVYTYDERGLLINFKTIENLKVKDPELADKNNYYGGRPVVEYDYQYAFQ